MADADIVILNEATFERHVAQLAGKKLILLQSDAAASLATCKAPKRRAFRSVSPRAQSLRRFLS